MRSISVIIPILNEEDEIEALLRNLKGAGEGFEVIFADGGSTDRTNEIIGKSHKIISSEKGRSKQMNAGAKSACGSIFFFLHADSRLPYGFCTEINKIFESGGMAGCFPIKFDSSAPLLSICAYMSNARARFRQIAFGDQGLFITRELFEDLGGFPEIPLMEDYMMSELIAQRTKIMLAEKYITTSARRFEKHGILRTMWLMQKLQYLYRKGVSTDILAEIYRSGK